jgi:hypothetical protein
MERKLPKPHNSSNSSIVAPTSPQPKKIRVISTFGSDSDLLHIVQRFEPDLTSSPSFASSSDLSPTPKMFQLVKRTGASLRNKLVKTKQMALNKTKQRTRCCKRKNCKCCPMISDKDSVEVNGIVAKPSGGTCISYNIIYCFVCTICTKGYIGRSVQQLNERLGQHRRNYYVMLKDINNALTDDLYRKDDEYSLGLHLIEVHSLCDKNSFENSFQVFIIDMCSPKSLEVNEHRFIHSLKTLQPHGLNAVDPFGIPLLRLKF